MIYTGTFYSGLRSPIPLFTFLNELLEESQLAKGNIELTILGDLSLKLQNQLKPLPSFSLVKIVQTVPHSEITNWLNKSHIGWLIIPDLNWHKNTVPTKFYEYIQARLVIIAFVPQDSEVAKIIRHFDIGLVLEENESGQAKLANFLLNFDVEFERIQKNYNEMPISDFSREHSSSQLLQLLREISK